MAETSIKCVLMQRILLNEAHWSGGVVRGRQTISEEKKKRTRQLHTECLLPLVYFIDEDRTMAETRNLIADSVCQELSSYSKALVAYKNVTSIELYSAQTLNGPDLNKIYVGLVNTSCWYYNNDFTELETSLAGVY